MPKLMSKDKKKGNKCRSKQGVMLAYGVIQLGARVISAISLVAIALSFCSVKQQAKVFNDCVEELRLSGSNSSEAVRFCNGGS